MFPERLVAPVGGEANFFILHGSFILREQVGQALRKSVSWADELQQISHATQVEVNDVPADSFCCNPIARLTCR